MNNKQRADSARKALKQYTDNNDIETDMSDLVCNLMHLCKESGVNWADVEFRAAEYYTYEIDPANKEECNQC